jgi:hypothetical protein
LAYSLGFRERARQILDDPVARSLREAKVYSESIDTEDSRLRKTCEEAEAKIEHADDLFKPFHPLRRNEDWNRRSGVAAF